MAMSTSHEDAESGALFTVEAVKSADPALTRPKRKLVEPKPLDRHGPARIIALCNQKGGVGKTTSTINLGAALAEVGRRVLLVDFDPQGALSVGLGVQPHQLDRTAYNLLMERGVNVDDILLKTSVPGMDLLPSNIDLSAAEVQLVGEVAREQTLSRVLTPVVEDYDFVLIDCQPSLGLLTVNALTAAHEVIVPARVRVLQLARRCAAHRHDREGARAAQPEAEARRHSRDYVRRSYAARARGVRARRRGVRGFSVRHRHI